MHLVEPSIDTPRAGYEPPEPAWKGFDSFKDCTRACRRSRVTAQFSCCHCIFPVVMQMAKSAICSPASEPPACLSHKGGA
jgi:hypothetical protein